LPDDVAFRLLRLIKAGNNYSVCIKSVTKNGISVFIREIKRGKKYYSQPSFISSTSEHSVTIKKEIKPKHHGDDLTEEEKSDHSDDE